MPLGIPIASTSPVITTLKLVDSIFLYTKPPAVLHFVLSKNPKAFDPLVVRKEATDDGYTADATALCRQLSKSALWLHSADTLYAQQVNYTEIAAPFTQLDHVTPGLS